MRLKNFSKTRLNKNLIKAISKHIDLNDYQVFYFGSRVTGYGDERSDIDVGIKGSQTINMVTMLKIKEEVENLPILYKIDIVDVNQSSPIFQKVALKNIELING